MWRKLFLSFYFSVQSRDLREIILRTGTRVKTVNTCAIEVIGREEMARAYITFRKENVVN